MTHSYDVFEDGEDFQEELQSATACMFYIVECGSCNKIVLYHSVEENLDTDEYWRGELIFPIRNSSYNAIPEGVLQIYKEAERVKNISPRSFANQIRVALEAICDEQGAIRGRLYKRLQDLASRGTFTPLLSGAADLIRKIGNDGSHFEGSGVAQWEVIALDDLFKLLVEYIYIGPSKIARFQESYDNISRRGNDMISGDTDE